MLLSAAAAPPHPQLLDYRFSQDTLVLAIISSRLDYCNSLLVGAADCVIRKLQGVQNAAARLITVTRKFDHTTPILRDLHWLPVHQRIKYKIAMLVNKCLRGLAPPYLAELCQSVVELAGRRHLRSAASGKLSVRRSQELCCFRSRHSEQSTNRPASFVLVDGNFCTTPEGTPVPQH